MADAKTKSDAGGDKKDEKKGKDDQKEQELVYILKHLFIFQFETSSELKMPHNNTVTKKHKNALSLQNHSCLIDLILRPINNLSNI